MNTLQDVTRRETVVGATGPGSRTLTYPKALNELLGTKFKIVSGYPGGNEITLALERGEVEGYCGWALGSIKTRAPDWIRDGKIRPLAQFTLAKSGVLPNVPLATDLASTDNGTPRDRVLRRRLGSGLAAGGAAGRAGGACGRAARGLQCDDAGPAASRRGGDPGPRYRPGERRGDRRRWSTAFMARRADVLDLVRKINASR